MPYRVNSCFESFIVYKVNLDTNRTRIARSSRDNLLVNLKELSDAGTLPKHYAEKNLHYGSFARKTKIRPLDDIDLMVCLSACGGHYTEITPNVLYTIKMQDNLDIYEELKDDQGNLNSRKLINRIIKGLTPLRDYKKAEIKRNQEAATLQLKSYEWNFDIVPCFYATDDFYLIPDGNGNWKKTDPRIDTQRMEHVKSVVRQWNTNANDLQTFIRVMKYWKKENWSDCVGSYLFEQMVLNYAQTKGLKSDWQSNVHECLLSLSQQILGTVNDPKGMQGDLNTLDADSRKKQSGIAYSDYQTSGKAITEEITADMFHGTHEKAISLWNEVFGDGFKLYGESY